MLSIQSSPDSSSARGGGGPTRRRRALPRLLLVVSLVVSAVALTLAVPAASGASVPSAGHITSFPSEGVVSPPISVKLANGQTWQMSVGFQYQDLGVPEIGGSLFIYLDHTVSSGGAGIEEHAWQIPAPGSSLTFHTGSKSGSLDTGTATSPIAAVDLAIAGSSSTKVACSSGKQTDYAVTLTGQVTVDTGLAKAGTIGGTHLTFAKSEVDIDDDCILAAKLPCASSIDWAGPVTSSVIAFGGSLIFDNLGDFVSVGTVVKLPSPANTSRVDEGLVRGAKPTYDKQARSVSVTATSSGLVTGSATISGGKTTVSKQSCAVGKKLETESVTDDVNAKISSPAGKAFTAHLELTPKLVAPSSGKGAGFEVITA